ncbi:MAG: DUF5519 family protein [Rhizobiaceae bacterium]|nr:DUF5519 family protein [Rhizobiaceae bacterium]
MNAPAGLDSTAPKLQRPTASPSRRIAAEILTWDGTGSRIGSRGELSFTIGKREIGHLHGDTLAHFFFPRPVWEELHAAARVTHHPVFPGKAGPAERRIRTEADVQDVIALMGLAYERLSREPAPKDAA